METQWWIGLSSWVLQDGNYPDFVTGEHRRFALELGYSRRHRLQPLAPTETSCRYTDSTTTYDVTGRLIRSTTEPRGDAFVLDVGIRVYTQWMVLDDLVPPRAGDWLTGEISLHVDPFFYKDELARRSGMPALSYTWAVEEIQLQTTPLIQVEHGHPLYNGPDEGVQLVVDPARESWETVDRTRTWEDHSGYRLRCTLLDPHPDHGPAA